MSGAACSFCRRAMEKADYCEAKLVFFERCQSCARIWVGSNELAAMAVMWARMDKRAARTRQRSAEDLALMDLLWFAQSNFR
ncbi:MAG TPA: hypothetical protein VN962_12295 [Polyangia bacterium]|nr:hypothetical protein [Polyangia bacterium]